MKTQLEALREQYRNARSRKKMDKIVQQMREIGKDNPQEFSRIVVGMAKDTADRAEQLALRVKLQEVLPAVSMSYVARHYFGKTRSWLYQRLNGYRVNGKPAQMTSEEEKRLEDALHDLGRKLMQTRLS